jgi:hypothetical protein
VKNDDLKRMLDKMGIRYSVDLVVLYDIDQDIYDMIKEIENNFKELT